MGKRGPKPKGNIDTTWRPELAYCVGLIASDGCLLNDGRHIDITSADKEQIENFKKALDIIHIKTGVKTSGSTKKKKYYRAQFGDVLFYEWLLQIGLHPNKSKTLRVLKIPDEFFFDFFRGCFDGDGSIYSFWDKRWKSSYVYWIGIASASPVFLDWIKESAFRIAKIDSFLSKSVRANELRFAKNATRKLVLYMYKDKNAYYLDRKFAKLYKILSIDERNP